MSEIGPHGVELHSTFIAFSYNLGDGFERWEYIEAPDAETASERAYAIGVPFPASWHGSPIAWRLLSPQEWSEEEPQLLDGIRYICRAHLDDGRVLYLNS